MRDERKQISSKDIMSQFKELLHTNITSKKNPRNSQLQ